MNKGPHRVVPDAARVVGVDQFQHRNPTESSPPIQPSATIAADDRRSVDDLAHQFLRLILPDRGHYVSMIVESEGRKYNNFAPTIEELWGIIKKADHAGQTAYHGCSSFKEARHDPKGTPRAHRQYGRTKRNVLGAKAFWLDVDAGPGKPYADWRAAAEAVATFCNVTVLPRPLVALSGLGLHVYWPLNRTLDPETWERYARGLKALCNKHRLQADPVRTADITSVLRTPGTHHRKVGPRLVQCGELVGPYALEQFEILQSISSDAGKAEPKRRTIEDELGATLPPYLKNRSSEGVGAKLHQSLSKIFESSFSVPIANSCEQVRTLRDSKGKVTEPLWYACLGVLAFAEDGEQYAHEWSSGDARYTEEETQGRLDRARQLSGATTCRRFHELKYEVCERCPRWGKITSPIVLGHRQDQGLRDNREQLDEEFHRQQDPHEQTDQQGQQDRTSQQEQAGQTSQEGKNSDSSGAKARSAFSLRWHGEENPNSNRNWLVKQLLPETGAGLISGQWGTGKTFIAIDLSISVMMSNPFAGRQVKRTGGVLFIAVEGASEIPIRLRGRLPGHKGKLPFAWAESCPTLTDKGAIEQLAGIAKEAADRMKSEFGVELVLIIIDTMSAAAGFKDENASSEGQLAMNVLNELSKRTGALVLACDHFGKMVDTGTRGTSAKEAAADVVIACLGDKTQAGHVTNLRIAVRKLRGGATGAETQFTLRTVDMGVDEDGDPITTCIVAWSPVTVAPPPEVGKGKGWPKSTSLFRVALVTTLKLYGKDQQVPPGGPTVFAVELDKVREEFAERYPLDGGDRQKQLGKRRQAFKRSMATAQTIGKVGGRQIDGKFMVWLTRPEDERNDAAKGCFWPGRGVTSVTNVTPP
jgi:hypothetical protein